MSQVPSPLPGADRRGRSVPAEEPVAATADQIEGRPREPWPVDQDRERAGTAGNRHDRSGYAAPGADGQPRPEGPANPAPAQHGASLFERPRGQRRRDRGSASTGQPTGQPGYPEQPSYQQQSEYQQPSGYGQQPAPGRFVGEPRYGQTPVERPAAARGYEQHPVEQPQPQPQQQQFGQQLWSVGEAPAVQSSIQPQYPDRQYPDRQYPDRQYPDRQYPDRQYPDRQYTDPRYADSGYAVPQPTDARYPEPGPVVPQYTDPRYAGSGQAESGHTVPQYGDPRYPDSGYAVPQHPVPQYEAPQYEAPQYEAPQYEAPQYEAPQYEAPQYEAPQYEAPQYEGPYRSPEPRHGRPAPSDPQFAPAGYPAGDHHQQPDRAGVGPDPFGPPPEAFAGAAGPSRRQARGMNGFAVAGLVTSLFGMIPVSLVLGVVALVQLRRGGGKGRGLAIAGLVLSVLWLVVVVAAVTFLVSRSVERDASGQVVAAGSVSLTELRIGDCVETWDDGGTVSSVRLVPCATAHDAQVYAEEDIAARGSGYPGDEKVYEQASAICDSASRSLDDADLPADAEVVLLHPLEQTWTSGDRGVTCLISSKGRLTASVVAG